MKAWTYLMVNFTVIKCGASAKEEFIHAMDHGESYHTASCSFQSSKHIPNPRHLPRPDIYPVLCCSDQKDGNVEGRGGDLASKDGRWLDNGRVEPFIAFCIICITLHNICLILH